LAVSDVVGEWTQYRLRNLVGLGEKISKRLPDDSEPDGQGIHPLCESAGGGSIVDRHARFGHSERPKAISKAMFSSPEFNRESSSVWRTD
jgi:hypothetical protein